MWWHDRRRSYFLLSRFSRRRGKMGQLRLRWSRVGAPLCGFVRTYVFWILNSHTHLFNINLNFILQYIYTDYVLQSPPGTDKDAHLQKLAQFVRSVWAMQNLMMTQKLTCSRTGTRRSKDFSLPRVYLALGICRADVHRVSDHIQHCGYARRWFARIRHRRFDRWSHWIRFGGLYRNVHRDESEYSRTFFIGLPSISFYSLTDLQAHTKNYAHLRNARTTGTTRRRSEMTTMMMWLCWVMGLMMRLRWRQWGRRRGRRRGVRRRRRELMCR